jgi:hypothetical protein
MLFPFGYGCNFAETGDITNDGRLPEGCADRVSLGGDQELSSFIRMIQQRNWRRNCFSNLKANKTVAVRAPNR